MILCLIVGLWHDHGLFLGNAIITYLAAGFSLIVGSFGGHYDVTMGSFGGHYQRRHNYIIMWTNGTVSTDHMHIVAF